jgi:hypothetical protein
MVSYEGYLNEVVAPKHQGTAMRWQLHVDGGHGVATSTWHRWDAPTRPGGTPGDGGIVDSGRRHHGQPVCVAFPEARAAFELASRLGVEGARPRHVHRRSRATPPPRRWSRCEAPQTPHQLQAGTSPVSRLRWRSSVLSGGLGRLLGSAGTGLPRAHINAGVGGPQVAIMTFQSR